MGNAASQIQPASKADTIKLRKLNIEKLFLIFPVLVSLLIPWLFFVLPHNVYASIDNQSLELWSYAHSIAVINRLPPDKFIKVISCESGGNNEAVGDHGLARGAMQYHEATFNADAKKFGVKADYKSAKDQIALAGMAFADGDTKKWTCANGLFP